MTFEEHVQANRNNDGSYDLDAAEKARTEELAADEAETLAAKAAKQERARWEATETANLRKQFSQAALAPELELDIKVPLGDSTAVDYGDMDHKRIRLRRDMRIKVHLAEIRAFDAEITHWGETEMLLDDGETIREALQRRDT